MFQLLRRRRPLLSAAAVVFAVLYATELAAQTAFVPYFGKNRVRYDNFQWHIYTTDHFQIYYYPEIEQHLERVAGYAESAYQHVSTELKHDLGARRSSSSRTSSRRRCPKAWPPSPSRRATGWCCRSTSRPTSSIG
jgi:hypothetical protein